jgi:hypothetical protein
VRTGFTDSKKCAIRAEPQLARRVLAALAVLSDRASNESLLKA